MYDPSMHLFYWDIVLRMVLKLLSEAQNLSNILRYILSGMFQED